MAEYFEKEKLCDWCLQTGPSYCDICVMNRHDLLAADVRPVVRGKWEYNPGDNIPYCSECMMPQDSECNFCPNCGAMMEES